MGFFSKSDSELDLDNLDQAAFEKPFSQGTQSKGPAPDYGVDKTIELIRELPQNDLPAVIGIVTHTLESMNIDVNAIIVDAEQKESRVSDRIKFLKSEIDALSSRIKQHGEEISLCNSELEEVSAIKRLLQSEDVTPAKASATSNSSGNRNTNTKAKKDANQELFEEDSMDSVALIGEETE